MEIALLGVKDTNFLGKGPVLFKVVRWKRECLEVCVCVCVWEGGVGDSIFERLCWVTFLTIHGVGP